ncbi:acetyl-CoA carboxylase biotin carboxyl carrier protein [Jeotgalibaca sp. A127]|uniref:acetyl-CoA carboxylase biotin carboxyl carrier protein n=1 Tax=Jeotgalibaca sp. A127 TaxID=3457324 RepID=UPI003FD605AA
MNYENIKELISLIDASSLKEMEYSKDGVFLRLSKNENQVMATTVAKTERPTEEQVVTSTPTIQTEASHIVEAAEGKIVSSPIVGVVYLQANPESAPYVAVGDTIEEGQVLCLVEAMKIMNEINSEYQGKIAEILVENGQVVEYNQPLFRVI